VFFQKEPLSKVFCNFITNLSIHILFQLLIMNSKKTIVLGATTTSYRTAYTAIHRLSSAGHEVINVGIREGEVAGIPIQTKPPKLTDINTITLYISPQHQFEWYDYILETCPKRLIFNPGTENPELAKLAQNQNIEVEFACTLVMLSIGVY